ncbi:hypothetical protein glysoja_045010 [Glycine soja]|uniref:Uncharacterized protein n=1 Tax=Glycine soja TaxID=3848 RepID=A0A0B2PZN2_GLYSO|nr:hypothetical protein glysoja_045010 [Glycine soja]
MQSVVERDYSNYKEVSGANNDEGLAIANLRIALQIIDALAKKGIAELFPIQVDMANIQKKKEEAKALKELKAKAQQKGSFEVLGSRKVERNKGSLS